MEPRVGQLVALAVGQAEDRAPGATPRADRLSVCTRLGERPLWWHQCFGAVQRRFFERRRHVPTLALQSFHRAGLALPAYHALFW